MKSRVCGEDGFGLIELLIAMVMLNVGILAVVAAFNSGIVALARSSHVSTATAMADREMEAYRGLTYATIGLLAGKASGGDATYGNDTACSTPGTNDKLCKTEGAANYNTFVIGACPSLVPSTSCDATTTGSIGPDHHSYRIDRYIQNYTPANGRAGKIVTVVVRDSQTGHIWAREASSFDASTG